jgi:hypothetical protein
MGRRNRHTVTVARTLPELEVHWQPEVATVTTGTEPPCACWAGPLAILQKGAQYAAGRCPPGAPGPGAAPGPGRAAFRPRVESDGGSRRVLGGPTCDQGHSPRAFLKIDGCKEVSSFGRSISRCRCEEFHRQCPSLFHRQCRCGVSPRVGEETCGLGCRMRRKRHSA